MISSSSEPGGIGSVPYGAAPLFLEVSAMTKKVVTLIALVTIFVLLLSFAYPSLGIRSERWWDLLLLVLVALL
jgi:hypothetical protein